MVGDGHPIISCFTHSEEKRKKGRDREHILSEPENGKRIKVKRIYSPGKKTLTEGGNAHG